MLIVSSIVLHLAEYIFILYLSRTFSIFNKHLVRVKNKKVKLLLNKPIYTGMTILDLSKLFMYEFHYDFVKREFGENAKLLMTDTDSLFYR